MSFVPFLFIPISIQFAGQIFSALVEKVYASSLNTIIPIILTAINVFIYTYIIKNCYTMTLSFRCVSYQTLEGAAQCKLFNTTNIVTFFSSLTSYLSQYPSTTFMIVSMLCYLYNCTTFFNCGTFLSIRDQTLILGGSILGFLVSAASLYPILHVDEWGDYFFAAFAGLAIVVFYFTYLFIKRRETKNLQILDEYESTINFDVIGSKGKYKQLVITGFRNCHPICLDDSLFKTAVEKWPGRCHVR
ncbi:hypothetical protein TVAG_322510 [Trichomonas vaginalis G3]|uniref:Uncharacterized protein n=1 Tax=Trichomonas vaginalis (strain ATCC PRA-98 / G3) TaxID=412133 RepID=A2EL03_TRIV3|nr:guanylate cyclase protein [Trichomonas vaginalis G3]EAY06631.1 hypothetical protein TVAG_322510 [Trichomonas vaginalis G3]KAI5552910.1 guanylate cyclase protein [Trichomonas vaginalis G3]|eukprot:XP_001318854.1 hypothetical protein [Trichomonas vaginalis G3]